MQNTFENWLVVSDVDGTLHNKMHRVPKRNKERIAEFVARGGNFTLASGRTVSCIEPAYNSVPCNQPAVILNGAGIYDVHAKKLLQSTPIEEKGMDFVNRVLQEFDSPLQSLDIAIYRADMVYVVKRGLLSDITLRFDGSAYTVTTIDAVPKDGWLRVMFWGMPTVIAKFAKFIASIPNPDVNFMYSSVGTIEMLQKGVHKGSGILQIAKSLGIAENHIAAIGDYYNDWDMLKTVGFSACAGQAPKKIQNLCKYHACHCNEGCVADLLEYIMYRYEE